MENSREEREVRILFLIGVYGKGLISFLEIVGAAIVYFVPVAFFTDIVVHLAQGELTEEPGDFLASHSLQFAQAFSIGAPGFIALYLLSRGLIKLLLIIALLKNQLWAYPSSLAVLALFVLYQLYQIATTHSLLIVILTVFDLGVMYFIWREYGIVRRHLGQATLQ